VRASRFILGWSVVASALLGLTASPYLRASPYVAQRLLSSTAIASGAYATSLGKFYGVRSLSTGTVGNVFDVTVWTGKDAFTDLGPGWVNDAMGSRFGGWNDKYHAAVWTTGTTATDLQPSSGGYSRSMVNGLAPGVEVGWGSGAGFVHAMMWRGTAASAVDLNPTGYTTSEAYGVSATAQVGSAQLSNVEHAMLWRGSKSSYVDLQPRTGFVASRAYSISRGRVVGAGSIHDKTFNWAHALMWTGTADSVVDLNPAGFGASVATKIVGDWVVGYGIPVGGKTHALMWDLSTPTPTVYDLHDDAAIGYDTSTAWNISSSGAIAGVTLMYPDASVPGGNFNAAIGWTPTGPRLPGDADLDGKVSFADFQILEENLGSTDSWWKTGDFNDDRVTDQADYALLIRHYGESVGAGAAASVPEPGAVVWVGVMGIMLVGRRFRGERGRKSCL